MKYSSPMDDFIQKYQEKYDQWLSGKQVSFSSKVIPVMESIDFKKWVLPSAQVLELLQSVKSIALMDCICRTHYSRCDKPRDVCLVFNSVADKFVAKGAAKYVSLQEAAESLKKANESGLVHLSLYMPDHEIYALCSCCTCCCHDLQLLVRFNRTDFVVRSEFLAVTDIDKCNSCNLCVERCVFDARVTIDAGIKFNTDACFGCGLCVTACKTKAITMELIG